MSEHDVAWLTEAIAETFNQVGNSCMMPALQSSPEHHPKGLSPNGLPPPKVAWTADPTPAPPPAATCAGTAEGACASAHVTSRSRNEYKQWVEQWRLLLKREQLAANDVHQGGCELLANSKEIKEDEAARARALAQLKHKLQEELWTIRGAVDAVKMQASSYATKTQASSCAAHPDQLENRLDIVKTQASGCGAYPDKIRYN
eukprot:334361-Pelagomonas_calceolata.AAC.1